MKKLLSHLLALRIVLTPRFWIQLFNLIRHGIPFIIRATINFSAFFILLIVFSLHKVFYGLASIPVLGRPVNYLILLWNKSLQKPLGSLIQKLDVNRQTNISRSYLIAIGYKNLLSKKTRTLVTILGMSVGIGVIVLLLSLGYGVEQLIINQVATLDELKIIDVTTGGNTALHLSQQVLQKISRFSHVTKVLPSVSLVGKININNAKTDIIAYGVTNPYFTLTNAKLLQGKLFDNNNTFANIGEVAGAETHVPLASLGSKVDGKIIDFNILPDLYATAWSSCSDDGQVLGVVKRIEGGMRGISYWGGEYDIHNNLDFAYDTNREIFVSKWIQATVPLYYEITDGSVLPELDSNGMPVWKQVCIQANELQITGQELVPAQQVLGVATSSASTTNHDTDESSLTTSVSSASADTTSTPTATDAATVQLDTMFANASITTGADGNQIITLNGTQQNSSTQKNLQFTSGVSKQAIVTTGFLDQFSIPRTQAVGKTFSVSLIVSRALMPNMPGKGETDEIAYKIIGVVSDDSNPYFYIPFSDIKSLKVNNYSQLKVLVDDKNNVTAVRKQIETLGFNTASTLDTVAQIQSLFSNLRLVLGLLGMVALGVASLGMFNTLTVSLLERTREIGGMKTMGMVSGEIQDLFLSEAMMMGLAGGIGGLTLGFLVGDLLSFLVSIFAIANGQGYLQLTYIPLFLIIFIIVSSFIVGIITGLYPAARAKKISALNALRYE